MKKFLIILSLPVLLIACGKADEEMPAVDPLEEQILALMVDVTCMYSEGGELRLEELYEKHGFGEMSREEVDAVYSKYGQNIQSRLEAQTAGCINNYLESQRLTSPVEL